MLLDGIARPAIILAREKTIHDPRLKLATSTLSFARNLFGARLERLGRRSRGRTADRARRRAAAAQGAGGPRRASARFAGQSVAGRPKGGARQGAQVPGLRGGRRANS